MLFVGNPEGNNMLKKIFCKVFRQFENPKILLYLVFLPIAAACSAFSAILIYSPAIFGESFAEIAPTIGIVLAIVGGIAAALAYASTKNIALKILALISGFMALLVIIAIVIMIWCVLFIIGLLTGGASNGSSEDERKSSAEKEEELTYGIELGDDYRYKQAECEFTWCRQPFCRLAGEVLGNRSFNGVTVADTSNKVIALWKKGSRDNEIVIYSLGEAEIGKIELKKYGEGFSALTKLRDAAK